jgi:hypothetical protein
MGGVIILENQRGGRREIIKGVGPTRRPHAGKVLVENFSISRAQRTFVSAWRPRVVVARHFPPVTARHMEFTIVGAASLDPLAGLA